MKPAGHKRYDDPPFERRNSSPWRMAWIGANIAAAAAVIGVLLITLVVDPLVNLMIKPRLTTALAAACPGYSVHIARVRCRVVRNRISLDSLSIVARGGVLSCAAGTLSLNGIGWMNVIRGGKLRLKDFRNVRLLAKNLELNFNRAQHTLRCERLRLSVPDSQMSAEALVFHPTQGDAAFFGESNYRKTRYDFSMPQCSATGVAILDLVQGPRYRTRCVRISDVSLDILVDKEKPAAEDPPAATTPGRLLSLIKGAVLIDSVRVTNGRLRYGERFAPDANPAAITFDNIRVEAENIANRNSRGDEEVFHAQGRFMKGGIMTLIMSIPIASPTWSFHYSGSLSEMDLDALNGYLVPGERIRITAGHLLSASYDIDVVSGRARGYVRGIYSNLTFAFINKKGGTNLFGAIAAFGINTFQIRRTNTPDKSGAMKIGTVNYTRKPDDGFFGLAWPALRTGIRDIVGF